MAKAKEKLSESLAAELTKVNNRIESLRGDLATVEPKLEAANAAFVGEQIEFESLLSIKNTRTLIADTIAALEEHRGGLEMRIEAAEKVEASAAAIGEMKKFVDTRRTSFARYIAARQTLSDAVEDLLSTRAEFDAAKLEFVDRLKLIAPAAASYPVIDKRRRAEFDAELAGLVDAGISKEDFEFAMSPQTFPEVPHAAVIRSAENYQAVQAATERMEQRNRNLDQMRAKAAEDRAKAEAAFEEDMKLRAAKQQLGRAARAEIGL